MKKLLLAVTLMLGLANLALADADTAALIDEKFTKARQLLQDQNATLVGSPSAAGQEDLALGKEALLFFGEAAANPQHTTDAQRELMAKRGAVVMAQRAAVEYFTGLALVGSTTVQDCMVEDDRLKTAVTGFLKGAQVLVQEYKDDKALAVIKVGLRGPKSFGATVYDRLLGNPELKKRLRSLDGKEVGDYAPQAVEPAPVVYDALIIDATGHSFKPALINRIFNSKNELVYDPSKVSQKVLVEQGCGEYTNSIDKAKAALAARGCKNPLVVKAAGTVSASDLSVAEEDAKAIFSANYKESFLAGAKVAFVLK